jgi:hypothetical protein
LGWLWWSLGGALGWLCTLESVPSLCLVYGLVGALGGLHTKLFANCVKFAGGGAANKKTQRQKDNRQKNEGKPHVPVCHLSVCLSCSVVALPRCGALSPSQRRIPPKTGKNPRNTRKALEIIVLLRESPVLAVFFQLPLPFVTTPRPQE